MPRTEDRTGLLLLGQYVLNCRDGFDPSDQRTAMKASRSLWAPLHDPTKLRRRHLRLGKPNS